MTIKALHIVSARLTISIWDIHRSWKVGANIGAKKGEKMSDLKPCPFCGGKGHISSREIRYIGKNYFGAKKIKMGVQIICGRCKARGGLATGEVIYASYQEQRKGLEPLENGAIEAWNRRASDE